MNLSRRAFGTALASSVLLAVAACGSGDPGDSGGGTTAAAAAGGTFPVTIDHRYGTTEIAAEPKRIAVVGLMEQDALLAVGVTPIATTEWFGNYPGAVWPWAQDELKAAGTEVPTVLTNADGIQFEKVAAARPDLIVARYSGITQEDYDTLTKIAPVIAQPPNQPIDWVAAWDEVALTMGRAVGREEQAQAKVDAVKAQIATAVTANPGFAEKTAMIATPYEGFWVYGSEDQRGVLLTELGFKTPAGLDEVTGKAFGANLSKERTDLLDVDGLVWLLADYDADKKKIDENTLYTGLGVHRNGGEIFISEDKQKVFNGATSFISVLSLPYLLDGLVPQLAAAVDGSTTTAVPASPA